MLESWAYSVGIAFDDYEHARNVFSAMTLALLTLSAVAVVSVQGFNAWDWARRLRPSESEGVSGETP